MSKRVKCKNCKYFKENICSLLKKHYALGRKRYCEYYSGIQKVVATSTIPIQRGYWQYKELEKKNKALGRFQKTGIAPEFMKKLKITEQHFNEQLIKETNYSEEDLKPVLGEEDEKDK